MLEELLLSFLMLPLKKDSFQSARAEYVLEMTKIIGAIPEFIQELLDKIVTLDECKANLFVLIYTTPPHLKELLKEYVSKFPTPTQGLAYTLEQAEEDFKYWLENRDIKEEKPKFFYNTKEQEKELYKREYKIDKIDTDHLKLLLDSSDLVEDLLNEEIFGLKEFI
jgi:hypothetical protein